jgi:hypothetical protein
MLIDVGGHQALRTTGGGKLDLRTLSFHGYTGPDTVEPGADDIEHGRYNDHDEEDRLPSPPIANAAAAAPIFCPWRSGHRHAGARRPTPGRAAAKQVNRAGGLLRRPARAGCTRSTCSSPSDSRTSQTELTPSSLGSSHDRGSRRPAPDK